MCQPTKEGRGGWKEGRNGASEGKLSFSGASPAASPDGRTERRTEGPTIDLRGRHAWSEPAKERGGGPSRARRRGHTAKQLKYRVKL